MWRTRRVVMFLALALAFLADRGFVEAECSNGLEGIESNGVCCFIGCGQCGGEGCSDVEGTRGDEDCCVNAIQDAGSICMVNTPVAPCIIESTPPPTPSMTPATQSPALSDQTLSPQVNTQTADPTIRPTVPMGTPSTTAPLTDGPINNVPTSSPQGGQTGSTPAPLTVQPSISPVSVTHQPSVVPTIAPTVKLPVTPTPKPTAISTTSPQLGNPTPTKAPTVAPILSTPTFASPTIAPTAPPFESSTCSNGMPGVGQGDICCAEACGQCGGSGCSSIPGTNGSSDCCEVAIESSGIICGENGAEAPCIIATTPVPTMGSEGTLPPTLEGTPAPSEATVSLSPSPTVVGSRAPTVREATGPTTPAPSPADDQEVEISPSPTIFPVGTPSPSEQQGDLSECSNGMVGFQHGVVCCSVDCGQCGGAGCESIIPGDDGSMCCSDIILAGGDLCNSDLGVSAPCIIGSANEVSADLRETNAASSLKYALTDSFGAVTLTTTCLAAALVVMMHNVMGA